MLNGPRAASVARRHRHWIVEIAGEYALARRQHGDCHIRHGGRSAGVCSSEIVDTHDSRIVVGVHDCALSATKAIGTLFREDLLPHSLVIIYSTIDACGLLDAPAQQTVATGESFKAWVRKYVLSYPGLEFNELDLWSARCAVLHSFTSGSSLSNEGKARELRSVARRVVPGKSRDSP